MSHQKTMKQPAVAAPPSGTFRLSVMAGIVLVIIAIAVGTFVLASRQPAYQPEVTGRAALQVDQEVFDYGTRHYHDMVNTSFQVKNVGDQTLYVLGTPQIEVVEGCCPPQTQISSKTIHPGESATVSFSFSMSAGMDGPHDFRVHVRTSDPVMPDKTVQVLSNWVP